MYKMRMDFGRRVIDANGVCHWESKHCYYDVPDEYVRTGSDDSWQLESLEMKKKVDRGLADPFEFAKVQKEGGDNVYQ